MLQKLRDKDLAAGMRLMNKLRVAELRGRDRGDVAGLLAGRELDKHGFRLIALHCADDWGLWRLVTGSLAALMQSPPAMKSERRNRFELAAAALSTSIRDEPKSVRWRVASLVGERIRWF